MKELILLALISLLSCHIISQDGIELIKKFEDCKLTAYQDIVGVWTIGYGTTNSDKNITGTDIYQGLTITQAQADEWLRVSINKKYGPRVDKYDNIYHWTQNEFDALCSFAYNIGSINNLVKDGNLSKASIPSAMEQYIYVNKTVVEGLVQRRQAEVQLFNKSVWLYFIFKNCSQFGTAALMGNFYSENKLEIANDQKDLDELLGLTPQEYEDQINKGIYTNFGEDSIGFRKAHRNLSIKKDKLLNMCKGKIDDLACQLDYVFYELSNDYKDLWEILQTCTDLKYCSKQFLFLYGISNNKTNEKQKEIFQYSKQYYNIYAEKCTKEQFFSIRSRKCVDFPNIPKECNDIALDGVEYEVYCKKMSRRCDSNSYEDINGDCLPLNNTDRIFQCAYYILFGGGEEFGNKTICYKCNNNYYRYCDYSNHPIFPSCQCIKVPEKVSHCIEYGSYSNKQYYCNLCESAEYYLYGDDKCYKVPKQINNCEMHEEFYNNEVSCLNIKQIEGNEISEKNSNNNYNINSLNLAVFILLILF